MKKLLIAIVTLTSLSVFADEQPAQKEVPVGISGVFVPGGFDSNSDAYVVVNGVFPNGCYRWSRADETRTDAFTHEIRSMATVTQGMCIMVLVPFQKDIRLGKLAVGKHMLRFVNGDGTFFEKSLSVEE
jgi:hypothetical protein